MASGSSKEREGRQIFNRGPFEYESISIAKFVKTLPYIDPDVWDTLASARGEMLMKLLQSTTG